MSYARMGETEQRLKQEVDALQQAEDTDAPRMRCTARASAATSCPMIAIARFMEKQR
jgi:hypothetical protein